MNLFKKTPKRIWLCKDCKYIVVPNSVHIQFAKCNHPNNGVNLVDGNVNTDYCEVVRLRRCGPEAQWFDPK